MLCSKCPTYDRSLKRCKRGKVNPRTKKQVEKIARIMGKSYICLQNEYRKDVNFSLGLF